MYFEQDTKSRVNMFHEKNNFLSKSVFKEKARRSLNIDQMVSLTLALNINWTVKSLFFERVQQLRILRQHSINIHNTDILWEISSCGCGSSTTTTQKKGKLPWGWHACVLSKKRQFLFFNSCFLFKKILAYESSQQVQDMSKCVCACVCKIESERRKIPDFSDLLINQQVEWEKLCTSEWDRILVTK